MNQNYNTITEILNKFFKNDVVTYDEIPMYKSYGEDEEFESSSDEYVSFEEFLLEEKLHRDFIIDDMVYVKAVLEPNDFNNNKAIIHKAYDVLIEIINEIKFNIPDIIKKGLDLLNYKIQIYSESYYNYFKGLNTLGLFDPNRKTIYIKLSLDTKDVLRALHHEIGHFIDYVNGLDDTIKHSDYASSNDERISEAFCGEVWYLRGYAKKSYQEFFAVAYEHKMTGGNMSKLKQINNITDYYLEKFRVNIEYIERCMRLDCWDY